MADTWTDRIKDFAYRHAPEWLQGRIDDRAEVWPSPDDARPTPVIAQRKTQPDMIGVEDIRRTPTWHEEYAKGTGMGEARDDEILRKYSAAIHRPGDVDVLPPPHQPTKTVDYIETHRYHDKHFRKGPTFEVRGPNDRQQSWTWER